MFTVDEYKPLLRGKEKGKIRVMPSVFPELLTYSLKGIFALRALLGILFVFYGAKKLWRQGLGVKWRIIGIIEVAAGILLTIGLFTQLAALIIVILMLGALAIKAKTGNEVLKSGVDFYLLLLVIAFALLLTGPGSYSFDLPL